MVQEGAEYVFSKKIWSFVVLWTVFLFIFIYASLCLLCTFSSEWSNVCGEGV